MDETQTQLMLAQGTMMGLGFVMNLAFFVVALTTVRQASREASSLMALGMSIHVLAGIAAPIVSFLGGRAAGVDGMIRLYTITTLVFGLLGLAASSLQLVGIVRLAQSRRGGPDRP